MRLPRSADWDLAGPGPLAGNDSASFEQIPRGDVTVNDPATTYSRGYRRDLPDGIGRRYEVCRGVMEFAQQRGHLDELVVAAQGRHRDAGQQREDFAVKAVHSHVARRVLEALVLSARRGPGPPTTMR